MNVPVLDPELLKAFVAVADHRSFTRAATMLNRTQSAVSMQIKRLEDRLGVELFHRTKVTVDISPAGEGLLGYARRILSLNDEAIGRIKGHLVGGRVRIGVMDDYGTAVLPPLLYGFLQAYPSVRVEMETGLTARMTERLGEDFDLVIAMHEKGRGDGRFLCREQAVWAASVTHQTERLDPLPVALYPPGCLFRKWATEALDAAGRAWDLSFVSHSLAAVEAIATQGLAVTVVKSGLLSPRLRLLTEKDGMPRLPSADIRLHQASGLSRAGVLLADHLVAKMKRTG